MIRNRRRNVASLRVIVMGSDGFGPGNRWEVPWSTQKCGMLEQFAVTSLSPEVGTPACTCTQPSEELERRTPPRLKHRMVGISQVVE